MFKTNRKYNMFLDTLYEYSLQLRSNKIAELLNFFNTIRSSISDGLSRNIFDYIFKLKMDKLHEIITENDVGENSIDPFIVAKLMSFINNKFDDQRVKRYHDYSNNFSFGPIVESEIELNATTLQTMNKVFEIMKQQVILKHFEKIRISVDKYSNKSSFETYDGLYCEIFLAGKTMKGARENFKIYPRVIFQLSKEFAKSMMYNNKIDVDYSSTLFALKIIKDEYGKKTRDRLIEHFELVIRNEEHLNKTFDELFQ